MFRQTVCALAASILALSACAHADDAVAAVQAPGNSFARFMGDWTLEDDRFQQVWDGKTVETLSIPGHFTHCAAINTDRSVLCVVDAGGLKGHILWVHDEASGTVGHLSHFGTARMGTGEGRLSPAGDLRLQVGFSDEPAGSYRIYEYVWLSADAYTMLSTQYDASGEPTGNWYGGTFVRVRASGD